ncbi:DNA alkylation repair protein [Roseibium polysiphoniae]|uniref:DNA alkylation repair protein n=1 Tax=Roseibium polysiphoniae TaxID=2571221 RepID=A0ABR9C6C7_9HYPH|nr:DNA alkylation repair protein [Roseibium polysiphoniae]MBD8875312.1 DNA alkylation repair protein [Roseibium polysiphoniae]
MAEPLKYLFNHALVEGMADHFSRHWSGFDARGFQQSVLDGFDELELKQRSNRVLEGLKTYLPEDYEKTAEIFLASLAPDDDADLAGAAITEAGIAGWAIAPMCDYAGQFGAAHFETSMDLMKELTKRLTAEFGIRYILLREPERCLQTLTGWIDDPSRHVRRLISEGTRPRLPWAMRLPAFIADPAPVLPLLEALRDDREEYVRRSVANHLNDISKDHPDVIADLARRWKDNGDRNRGRLIKHACRSLIKQGHPGTLSALGYGSPQISVEAFHATERVTLGDAIEFGITLKSTAETTQPLVVDFVIHHRKANGKTAPKVFKWKTFELESDQDIRLLKRHSIRPITTRTYYPGTHSIEVQVNGQSVAKADFELDV